MFSEIGLGLGIILAGLVFLVLFWLLLRLLPRNQSISGTGTPSFLPFESQTNNAIIVLQPGGRVEYVNPLAREAFGLNAEETSDLERLARRVRPPDEFLDLCVTETEKRLSVNGHLMDATSYRVPGYTPLMLLTFRAMDITPVLTGAEGTGASNSLLKVVADFGEAVHSSLRLHDTLQAVFENTGRLVSADVLEVKLWDEKTDSQTVYTYDETSNTEHVARVARSRFGRYSDILFAERQPIFQANENAAAPAGGQDGFLAKSYIGLPLSVDGKFLGTLEVAQTATAGLTRQDFELLQVIAPQVAVALRNARHYEDEQEHVAELTGLARLAQAAGSIQNTKELFARLVETIAPLFDVEMVGFLLYNESDRVLEGQAPFQGMPENVVTVYRSVIQPESPGEAVISGQAPILTLDAPNEDAMRALGLHEIARLSSIRETIMLPLVSTGRFVGYLQIANHRGRTESFTADELRLGRIIANQSATIIDNAVLVQQAHQRSQRSEALRRIASLVASSATLDEVIQFSLQELTQLLKADTAAIYLLDPQTHTLNLHAQSVLGVRPELQRVLSHLDLTERQFQYATVSGSQRPFLSGRLSTDERVSPAYRPIMESIIVESAVIVPLMARENSVGELLLGSRVADFFNSYDLQVLSTAAGLLAAAVEGARLLRQTDDTLRRRVEQLTAITHVTRELNSLMELPQLLEVIYEQSLRTTRADCGTILLFDPASDPGDPRITYSLGCEVDEAVTSLTRQSFAERQILSIADFDEALLKPPHAGIRSALVVPIFYQSKIYGMIHLHALQPEFFDATARETIQTFAIQAAVALGNAQRYQEQFKDAEQLRRRAAALAHIADLSTGVNYEIPLNESLLNVARSIQDSTPFEIALISVYESETGLLRRVAGVGMPQETLDELLTHKQPLQSLQQLLDPEFKIGRSYFIPADQTPVIPSDVHTVTALPSHPTVGGVNIWNPEDFLLIPLESPDEKPIGLISVDAPRDNLRPDRSTIELLETFATQATLVILNHKRVSELNGRIQSLTAGLQRQQRLLSITQNDLPTLLRKDLEQTISIHDLDRRAQRIRAGLAITESVSRQLDAPSALLALGREMLTQLGMSVALIAEEAPDGARLLHVLGSVPRAANPEALFGQRNPLRACLQTGEAIIIPNLDENDEWRESALLTAMRSKGVVCLPLTIENRTVAAVLTVTPEPLAGLTSEDTQVYSQIARQASIVLQNIALLNETRRRLQEVDLLLDFSQQLADLNPDTIMRSLLESARRVLPAAHAGSVLLWDPQSLRLTPRAVSGYADNEGMKRISFAPGEALPGTVFTLAKSRRVDEVNFTRDYPLTSESLLLYRQVTGGRLPVSSLLIPILAGEQCLGVLVLDNFNTPAAFKQDDENLLISLSQQVALSLENVRLVQAAQERAGQLQALTNVAAIITSSLQSRELTSTLLDQLEQVLPYDTATLWLRDKDQLSVGAARGFPDTESRVGISVSLDDSALLKQMIRTGQSLSVGDVRDDPRFPPLEAPRLSWLGLPLIAKGEVNGHIALEKWQANVYQGE
jgi:GAF domain-containing protein